MNKKIVLVLGLFLVMLISLGVLAEQLRSSQISSYITEQEKQIDDVWIMVGKALKIVKAQNNQVYVNGEWKPQSETTTTPLSGWGSGSGGEGILATLTSEQRLMIEIYDTHKEIIKTAADNNGVPVSLIVAIIYQESKGDIRAVSSCGAAGLMQLIPSTAIDRGLIVQFDNVPAEINEELKGLSNNKDGKGYNAVITKYDLWKVCEPNLCGTIVSPCNKCYQSEYCDLDNDQRFEPDSSITAGVKYLKSKLKSDKKDDDWFGALADYHGSTNIGASESYARTVLGLKESYEEAKDLNEWRFDPEVALQWKDASPELKKLLSCMRGKLPSNVGRISSISDSKGLATCRDSWTDSNCAHVKGSAHYGCSGQSSQSLAVDFGDEDNTCTIVAAARACGIDGAHIFGPKYKLTGCETQYKGLDGHENHVHISVQSARCY